MSEQIPVFEGEVPRGFFVPDRARVLGEATTHYPEAGCAEHTQLYLNARGHFIFVTRAFDTELGEHCLPAQLTNRTEALAWLSQNRIETPPALLRRLGLIDFDSLSSDHTQTEAEASRSVRRAETEPPLLGDPNRLREQLVTTAVSGAPTDPPGAPSPLDNLRLTLAERAALGCDEAQRLLVPSAPHPPVPWTNSLVPDPLVQRLSAPELAAHCRELLSNYAPDGFIRKALASMPEGRAMIQAWRAEGIDLGATLAIIEEHATRCLPGEIPPRPDRLLLGDVVNYLREITAACDGATTQAAPKSEVNGGHPDRPVEVEPSSAPGQPTPERSNDEWDAEACGLLTMLLQSGEKKATKVFPLLKQRHYPHSRTAMYKLPRFCALAVRLGMMVKDAEKTGRVRRGIKRKDGSVEVEDDGAAAA